VRITLSLHISPSLGCARTCCGHTGVSSKRVSFKGFPPPQQSCYIVVSCTCVHSSRLGPAWPTWVKLLSRGWRALGNPAPPGCGHHPGTNLGVTAHPGAVSTAWPEPRSGPRGSQFGGHCAFCPHLAEACFQEKRLTQLGPWGTQSGCYCTCGGHWETRLRPGCGPPQDAQ